MAGTATTRALAPILLNGASASGVAAERITSEVSTVGSPKRPATVGVGVMSRMRSIMRRQQCIEQHEALYNCFNQNSREGSTTCSMYLDALRYCELQTQQHNYPVNTAYLF